MRAAIPRAGALAFNLVMVLLATLLFTACMAEDDRANVPVIPIDGVTPGTYSEVAAIISSKGCLTCHGATATKNCQECHSSIAPVGVTSADIAVLDHIGMVGIASTAVAGETIVDAGLSDTSVFYWVASGDARYNGGMLADMKVGGLSAADKALIASWIDDGAQDN